MVPNLLSRSPSQGSGNFGTGFSPSGKLSPSETGSFRHELGTLVNKYEPVFPQSQEPISDTVISKNSMPSRLILKTPSTPAIDSSPLPNETTTTDLDEFTDSPPEEGLQSPLSTSDQSLIPTFSQPPVPSESLNKTFLITDGNASMEGKTLFAVQSSNPVTFNSQPAINPLAIDSSQGFSANMDGLSSSEKLGASQPSSAENSDSFQVVESKQGLIVIPMQLLQNPINPPSVSGKSSEKTPSAAGLITSSGEKQQLLKNRLNLGGDAAVLNQLAPQEIADSSQHVSADSLPSDLSAFQKTIVKPAEIAEPQEVRVDVKPPENLSSRQRLSAESLLGAASAAVNTVKTKNELDQKIQLDQILIPVTPQKIPLEIKNSVFQTTLSNGTATTAAPLSTALTDTLKPGLSPKQEAFLQKNQMAPSSTSPLDLSELDSAKNRHSTVFIQSETPSSGTNQAVSQEIGMVSSEFKGTPLDKKQKKILSVEGTHSPFTNKTTNRSAENLTVAGQSMTDARLAARESALQSKYNPQQLFNFIHQSQNRNEDIILQLDPEELGKIAVKMSRSETGMTLDMRVETPEAKKLLESNMAALQARFQDPDLPLNKIQISVGSDGSSFFSDSRQPSQQGESSQRTPTQTTRHSLGDSPPVEASSGRTATPSGVSLYA